jgi:hypothetical protein
VGKSITPRRALCAVARAGAQHSDAAVKRQRHVLPCVRAVSGGRFALSCAEGADFREARDRNCSSHRDRSRSHSRAIPGGSQAARTSAQARRFSGRDCALGTCILGSQSCSGSAHAECVHPRIGKHRSIRKRLEDINGDGHAIATQSPQKGLQSEVIFGVSSQSFLLVHSTFLHHEAHVLERAHVLEWIVTDGDDVG